MTVAELIAELEKFASDMEVYLFAEPGYLGSLDRVRSVFYMSKKRLDSEAEDHENILVIE